MVEPLIERAFRRLLYAQQPLLDRAAHGSGEVRRGEVAQQRLLLGLDERLEPVRQLLGRFDSLDGARDQRHTQAELLL